MKLQHHLLSRFVLIGAMFVAGSAVAGASPCVVGTLQSYIDLDQSGGCTIGAAPDNTFFRFTFSSSYTGNATVANASEITVTPIDTSTAFGLSFSANVNGTNLFSTPAGGAVTYHINYSIDPVNGGPDLSLDPVTGDVSASQEYCLNDVLPACSNGVSLSLSVSNDNPPSSLSSQALWPISPNDISLIDVNTTITLNGPASFDALNSLFLTTAVPEPANILLVGCGLFMFVVMLYGKRRFGLRKTRASRVISFGSGLSHWASRWYPQAQRGSRVHGTGKSADFGELFQ